jgi:hypothetical protein
MTYLQSFAIPVEQRGSSSVAGTANLCQQLPALFERHNIKKIFDAGANDCAWQQQALANIVEYSAGDHNPLMVAVARANYPTIDIIEHNILFDDFPLVDCLFIRDVAIHFTNDQRRTMIANWLASGTPWLLITQQAYIVENLETTHLSGQVPFSDLNWQIAPWNFPSPTDSVVDEPSIVPGIAPGRFMFLWHRNQILGLI